MGELYFKRGLKMGLFSKFKELRAMIREVENSVYGEKQDYSEIYERNLQLERDIEERTRELSLANKRMLSLQHIWDMMNSSKPLQNVLETVVNSFQGELGYLHSNIISKSKDDDGDYMYILAQSRDITIQQVNNIVKTPMQLRRLPYIEGGIFEESLSSKKIIQTKDFKSVFQSLIPEWTEEMHKKVMSTVSSKSLIVIPLYTMNKPFGWFCVFSSREELSDVETDFLSIYAQQIEMAITIADLFEALKEQAVTDSLTGLYNRRYFEELLQKEVVRAKRQNQPFSIIGLDLDFLKQINDKFGHSFGDLAIKTVADVLKRNARSIDTAARMGGEEFNVILPGIDSKGAMAAAERIRKTLEEQRLDTIGRITASVGVATFFEHSDNIDELLELTDQAMYLSKRNGRNRVTMATPISETSWQQIAVNTFVDILSKHNIPIDENLSKELQKKLQESSNENSPKDALFSVADVLTSSYNPLHSQGAIKSKVQIAVSLAKRFDLTTHEIDNLRIAMLLYDIGNLMLPPEILQKTTPLTMEERDRIKSHPIIAAREILKPITYIQDVIPIIEHHHENWDGSGYPNKIKKEDIPMTSQIVLIVDSYFALIEPRPYRARLTPESAIEIIQQDAGIKWNKTLVDEFVNLIKHDFS
ncbi:diguanylate cyclase [bacterium]|nr:diguanylate cyclase [bacterium]